MKKLRLPSKKTVKRSIVNYTKMLFRTKGMTCNHTLQGSRFNRTLYEFRPITSIHHIMESVKSVPKHSMKFFQPNVLAFKKL